MATLGHNLLAAIQIALVGNAADTVEQHYARHHQTLSSYDVTKLPLR